MTLRDAHVGSLHRTPPDRTPRLRLKPKARQSGYVDGAWWPWSNDLQKELPDLLAVLSVRLGGIDRVSYNLGEWATAPTKFTTGGTKVRLGGFTHQPINTIEVLGVDRTRMALLVVPPGTDPDNAHAAMMAAASPGNDAPVDALLKSGE
ncbi:MAG TPA: DUF5994 family protein [Mycobacterium sp.]|nr:DUF5994 family protein [Mycobacterium sp.]